MSISLIQQLLIKGNCGPITDIVDVLSLIVCGFLTAMKVIILRIYHSNMKVIINSAIEDWATIKDDRCVNIMIRYAYSGRVIFIIQMIGAYAAGFPLIFSRLPFMSALWNEKKNITVYSVPIGPSCWILGEIDPSKYIAYFAFQSIQLFIVCTGYIGIDTYFFGIAMHVCGQYELLYNEFQRFYDTQNPLHQKVKLSKFINRHKHLLNVANHFEQSFNLIILAQVAADTLLTSISGKFQNKKSFPGPIRRLCWY
uniref:Olfactory receptor 86 n=1 Tax=Aulacocentrum confusum TaxID=2767324 RepID=A0A7G8Z9A5_9HYME|nr:olfactory receptor 86 [Aulacocentrum confusum]